jgi:hypothetical protein
MDLGQIDMLRKGDLVRGPAACMTAVGDDAPGGGWLRLSVLALAVVAVGLPINDTGDYAALLIVAVVVLCGSVSTRPRAWAAAAGVVVFAVLIQAALSPPRIEEGHNVFLPSAALERALPADVYRQMLAEFDALYPPAQRCDPKQFGCWQHGRFPDEPFAFSADGIWRKTAYSRTVTKLDFTDPVWLRLGFINDLRYNWYTTYPDVHRADRERGPFKGLRRWHLAMPWYEVIRVPAEFVGGELCWRGTVMWEREGGQFTPLSGSACRAIEPADAGRRIFGIAVRPDTLSMRLSSPWSVAQLNFWRRVAALAAAVALIAMLVRFKARQTIVPVLLIGLAVTIIALDDASFLGGVRPFDGGDDGLFYDSVGRVILQKILAGDFYGALEGGEKVFYYGGPGLRYFRAIEHAVFGETYLGYLSFILLYPFLTYQLFRRFLPELWSLGLTILFVAVPIGFVFGTTFVLYVRWASRGFADPLAYILFVAGLLVLLNTVRTAAASFPSAFLAALLFALAIFVKPFVAPGAAVLLAGAGLAALYRRDWIRLAGFCIGFLPVFSMALHNWVYGGVFVLFSTNSTHPDVLVMPPSAYLAAGQELLRLDFLGIHVTRWAGNIVSWLTGPSTLPWRPYAPLVCALILLHAASLVILARVTIWGRTFDPWLRLIGASALAQHALVLFYTAAVARYHFLTWFLTMLVVMAWFHREGIEYMKRRYPALSRRFATHPLSLRLASWLARLQKVSA